MKNILIIFISTILFWGCGGDSNVDSTKISATKNDIVTMTSTDTNIDIEYVNTVGLHGYALDIALSDDGEFAYIASGDRGLEVLDISDPSKAKLIGTYDSYGYVNHVEVVGDTAYVSYLAQSWESYEQINAYNISNPYNTEYLGYKEGFINNNNTTIETDDRLYYLIANELHIKSKTDEDNQASFTLYEPYAIAVKDSYIFVANGKEGITILKTK